METACKNTKYKSLDDLPAIFGVKDLAEIMGINLTKAYQLVKQQDFYSIKIGNRILIPKKQFKRWLEEASLCEKFKNNYKSLSRNERKLYEEAFWEAVNFLKKQEAKENDRKAKIKMLSQ